MGNCHSYCVFAVIYAALLLFSCGGRGRITFRSTPAGIIAPAVVRFARDLPKSSRPNAAVRRFLHKHAGRLPFVNGDSVTFVYHGKPGVPAAVVGDFNGWHRLKDVMREVPGTGFYYLSLRLPGVRKSGVHYMLARNCRKMQDFVNDPENRFISFKKADHASWVVPPGYRGGRHIIVHGAFPVTIFPGGPAGTGNAIPPGLKTKVKPKRIIAWLPSSYFTDKKKRYPVLYMHDEQNIWTGMGMSWGGWKTDSTAARLVREGRVRECIIIGLPHSGKTRIPEYSPPYLLQDSIYTKGVRGWGDQYLQYLLSVKKYIDKKYRTLPDRKNTAVAGSSMGGLISWYIAWRCPEVFGTAGCISPWFVFRYRDRKGQKVDFGKLIAKGPKKPVRFYLDCGDSGWRKDGKSGTVNARDALIKAGWRIGRDLRFVLEKGGVHNERAWARRFPGFLRWVFPR